MACDDAPSTVLSVAIRHPGRVQWSGPAEDQSKRLGALACGLRRKLRSVTEHSTPPECRRPHQRLNLLNNEENQILFENNVTSPSTAGQGSALEIQGKRQQGKRRGGTKTQKPALHPSGNLTIRLPGVPTAENCGGYTAVFSQMNVHDDITTQSGPPRVDEETRRRGDEATTRRGDEETRRRGEEETRTRRRGRGARTLR